MTERIESAIPNRTPARKSSAADREILQNYLDDIFDTPVLETEEQHELFEKLVGLRSVHLLEALVVSSPEFPMRRASMKPPSSRTSS